MCCKNFWKRIIPFAIALAIGFFAVSIFQRNKVLGETPKKLKPIITTVNDEKGWGYSGACFGKNSKNREFSTKYFEENYKEKNIETLKSNNYDRNGLRIISKPRAKYTDLAKQNKTEGKVTLRVTFFANGKIGTITDVSTLPYGLTEEAIAAAKQIKFEPANRNGKTVSVTKLVQYNFTIY